MDARFDSFPFQDGQFPPLGAKAYAPVVPTRAMGFTDDEEWEVVGESRYLDGIRRIKEVMDADDEGGTLFAQLIAEPLNEFDRHAVRVDLVWDYQRETCGYLPREQAFRLQPLVVQAADDGLIVLREASLYGGTPDRPNIGVWLSPPPMSSDSQDYADFRAERAADERDDSAAAQRADAVAREHREAVVAEQAAPSGKRSLWKRLGF
ncbi:hypothetical protein J2X03_001292 [Microbacterium trichothecenolyticum]|uniref:hypothetical protein n=1 Tax=Microbacterium trichothecenolyticum TaxID=69370 RepID=UPI00285C8F9A|nr:hypothetical protein [Microbacterium trichothecenolyticum]MDR7111428.1 hypothetical protein [Microbacterium trichothecenolyticum]